MPEVDLNIDLGELASEPDELYGLATVVNVACGGHAGDASSMRHAIEQALARGTRIAAHPSYPDRENFGRRSVPMAPSVLYEAIVDQVEELAHQARALGGTLWGAKLHGALYHDAARDAEIAAAVLDAVAAAHPDPLTIVGTETGVLAAESRARGFRYQREGFGDRGYDAEGKLLPRGAPGALLLDPVACAEQAERLARTGRFETICVHGDTPGALTIVRAVRAALERAHLLVA
jgi:UPF0271 protein